MNTIRMFIFTGTLYNIRGSVRSGGFVHIARANENNGEFVEAHKVRGKLDGW